jgi:hypothetical protein
VSGHLCPSVARGAQLLPLALQSRHSERERRQISCRIHFLVVVKDTALLALALEDCPNPSLSFSELCTGEAGLQYTILNWGPSMRSKDDNICLTLAAIEVSNTASGSVICF